MLSRLRARRVPRYSYSSQWNTPPSGFGKVQSSRFSQIEHNPGYHSRFAISQRSRSSFRTADEGAGVACTPSNSSQVVTGRSTDRGNVQVGSLTQVVQSPGYHSRLANRLRSDVGFFDGDAVENERLRRSASSRLLAEGLIVVMTLLPMFGDHLGRVHSDSSRRQ